MLRNAKVGDRVEYMDGTFGTITGFNPPNNNYEFPEAVLIKKDSDESNWEGWSYERSGITGAFGPINDDPEDPTVTIKRLITQEIEPEYTYDNVQLDNSITVYKPIRLVRK